MVRTDLGMDTGKIASQAGHAYLGAFLQASSDTQNEYHKEYPEHPGTKVCLKCPSLEHLLITEEKAKELGIPCFKVTDSGCKNFFDGQPIITALGLGPATKAQIHQITKKYKLL